MTRKRIKQLSILSAFAIIAALHYHTPQIIEAERVRIHNFG